MPAPRKFVAHLAHHQYHPRSNKHGAALCEYVLEDLLLDSGVLTIPPAKPLFS